MPSPLQYGRLSEVCYYAKASGGDYTRLVWERVTLQLLLTSQPTNDCRHHIGKSIGHSSSLMFLGLLQHLPKCIPPWSARWLPRWIFKTISVYNYNTIHALKKSNSYAIILYNKELLLEFYQLSQLYPFFLTDFWGVIESKCPPSQKVFSCLHNSFFPSLPALPNPCATIDLLSVAIDWFAFSRILYEWNHSVYSFLTGLFHSA